jgi:hypothetical protein
LINSSAVCANDITVRDMARIVNVKNLIVFIFICLLQFNILSDLWAVFCVNSVRLYMSG